MLLIDLLGADQLLEGQLSRKLLEIRAGVYVGSLSKRQMEILWTAVVESKPQASLLVYSAKNEIGISIKSTGNHRYRVIDSDGLPLVSFKRDFGERRCVS